MRIFIYKNKIPPSMVKIQMGYSVSSKITEYPICAEKL